MQIHCRCGQAFTILNDRFPNRISCHICGGHFHVLDDGTVIDADSTTEINPAPATSIKSSHGLSAAGITPNPASAAIQNAQAKLSADLRLIDLLWKTERETHSLIPLLGITILPSKMLSIAVALTFVAIWGVLLALAISTNNRSWLCPGTVGVAISVFFPIYIYTTAHKLEKAEAEWSRKRTLAIAKSGLPAESAEDLTTKRPLWVKLMFWCSLAAVLVVAADYLVPRVQGIYWVGSRDLEITFVVTEADTGEPIAGAEIDIPGSKSSFCDNCDNPLRLVTDANGQAKKLCNRCMCFGYSGTKALFQHVDTFGTHVPSWHFHVSAPAHRNSDLIFLEQQEFLRTIQRGDKVATMQVAIKLHRVPDKK